MILLSPLTEMLTCIICCISGSFWVVIILTHLALMKTEEVQSIIALPGGLACIPSASQLVNRQLGAEPKEPDSKLHIFSYIAVVWIWFMSLPKVHMITVKGWSPGDGTSRWCGPLTGGSWLQVIGHGKNALKKIMKHQKCLFALASRWNQFTQHVILSSPSLLLCEVLTAPNQWSPYQKL